MYELCTVNIRMILLDQLNSLEVYINSADPTQIDVIFSGAVQTNFQGGGILFCAPTW